MHAPVSLPWPVRAATGVAGLLPVGLLLVAGTLRPSDSGLGTHQQLGLPPCSMRLIFGIRCPACGMTTSWSHFARGEWTASLASNTGGFLLAIAAVGTLITATWVAWSAKWPSSTIQKRWAIAAAVIATVTTVDWLHRLYR